METLTLSSRTLVADLLATTPPVAAVFVELRLGCVGCSLNKFCTLEDVCDQYQLNLETLIRMIQERTNNYGSD